MDFKEAVKRYRNASADAFEKPDKVKSYLRNDAWHLLGDSSELLAVVFTDGTVTHGAALAAWSRQFAQGQPSPARQPSVTGHKAK
jgi:hypothetical protein